MATHAEEIDAIRNGPGLVPRDVVVRELDRLVEIERCARGVVLTAHPERIGDAVVSAWWRALRSALEVEK